MGTPGCPYLRGVYIFMTPGENETTHDRDTNLHRPCGVLQPSTDGHDDAENCTGSGVGDRSFSGMRPRTK